MYDEQNNLSPLNPSSQTIIENEIQEASYSDTKRGLSSRAVIGSLAVLIIGALIAVAVWQFGGAASPAAANAPSGPPPALVVLAQAESLVMSPQTTLPGTVVSLRDALIASETSGKVLSVALVGEVVNEGQSLAQIDARDARQLLDQRQAELERLESLHRYHKDYYERVGSQENPLGIPEITIAQLRSNVETSKADVARAQSAVESAQTQLERTQIKAPFTGRIVSQSIQTGEFAQTGSEIARLVDTQNLEVSARVPASLVQPLEAGTMLEVSSDGATFQAPLRALVPVGDEVSRTMELRVTLPATELLVGTPVRVSLPTAQSREVIAVPRDAVVLRPQQQYVFVVNDGVASKRNVELGYGEGQMIEVIGELQAGDQVVIRGGERLRDGQSVKAHNGSL